MQRTLRVPALVLAALFAAASLAQAAGLATQAGSKLWLDGSSTVHAYSSTASKLQVTFQHDPAAWPADATGGDAIERLIREKGVKSMEVVVDVAGMRSGKDGLDKNMRKSLKADKHPEIRFRMAGYELAKATAPMTIDAKGTLNVAGVDQAIQLSVTATREGDTVRLKGTAPLLMTQFGIKPPTMMMGAMRTSDKIVVHFDLIVGVKDAAEVSKAE